MFNYDIKIILTLLSFDKFVTKTKSKSPDITFCFTASLSILENFTWTSGISYRISLISWKLDVLCSDISQMFNSCLFKLCATICT